MVMFLGAITSKIAPPRLGLLNTIAAGVICTGALVLVFFVMPIATR